MNTIDPATAAIHLAHLAVRLFSIHPVVTGLLLLFVLPVIIFAIVVPKWISARAERLKAEKARYEAEIARYEAETARYEAETRRWAVMSRAAAGDQAPSGRDDTPP